MYRKKKKKKGMTGIQDLIWNPAVVKNKKESNDSITPIDQSQIASSCLSLWFFSNQTQAVRHRVINKEMIEILDEINQVNS